MGAALIGGVIAVGGALAAAIVDDAVLGEVKRQDATSVRVTPLVSPRSKALGLTLAGAF